MKEGTSNRREYGDAIVERASKLKSTPPALSAALTRFKRAHAAYDAAAAQADKAVAARDKVLAVLSIADAGVDKAVITMGHKMVGAEMTPPNSPFKGFTKFAPTELITLKFSDEYREAAKLVVKVAGAKSATGDVKKAVREVSAKLAVANKALGAVTNPQTQVTEALTLRESLVPEWDAALHSVKVQGQAAWESTPAKLAALLAPAPSAQRGTKKRTTSRRPRKPRAVTPAPATPSGTT